MKYIFQQPFALICVPNKILTSGWTVFKRLHQPLGEWSVHFLQLDWKLFLRYERRLQDWKIFDIFYNQSGSKIRWVILSYVDLKSYTIFTNSNSVSSLTNNMIERYASMTCKYFKWTAVQPINNNILLGKIKITWLICMFV